MKFHHGIAAMAVALGVAASAAPAKASTISEAISFSFDAAYQGYPTVPYDGTALINVSFDITFDPTVSVFTPTLINGVISDLSYTVTSSNPEYTGPLTFNKISLVYLRVWHPRFG